MKEENKNEQVKSEQNQQILNSSIKRTKAYNRTILILCLLLVIMGGSTVFLSSNSLKNQTSTSTIIQTSNVSSADMQKASEFLKEILQYVNKLDTSTDASELKVDIAAKIYELANNEYDSSAVDAVAAQLLNVLNNSFTNGKSLISSVGTSITDTISSLSTSLDELIINYDERVQIESTTAALSTEAGDSYKVTLNAYIYYAEEKSTKWAVIVHPFLTNGKIYAQTIADMYLSQGYNVIAPDLRGFGKSEGAVAMGYLESLDIWDWLTYINDSSSEYIGDRKATSVIVHGTSLGGATTLQLWTQAGMNRDLTTKNVVGLVDDCGYDSMTGIMEGLLDTVSGVELLGKILNLTGNDSLYDLIGEENIKTYLINSVDVGISEADFDVKQNSLASSRTMSKVPLFIIHGTSDSIVPYSISNDKVAPAAKNANLLYDFWQVEGQEHAFIIIGLNKTDYTNKITTFIKSLESNQSSNDTTNDNTTASEEENAKGIEDNSSEDTGVFTKIKNAISSFFTAIGNFFKNLFS